MDRVNRQGRGVVAYIHTYIHTYIQTDRQTDRHTYIHTYIRLLRLPLQGFSVTMANHLTTN